MSDNEKMTKPKYEAPIVVGLSELARGAGQCTAPGSGNLVYCESGIAPGSYCTAGTNALTACTGGDTANTACTDGTGATTGCTAGPTF